MTPEQVKTELKQYLPTKSNLAAAQEELVSLHARLDGLRAVVNSGMPIRTGGVSDPVAVSILRLEAATERLEQSIDELAGSLARTEQLIILADDVYGQSIIRWRWQRGVSFREICAKVYLERTAMFEHYERAIEEICAKTERAD